MKHCVVTLPFPILKSKGKYCMADKPSHVSRVSFSYPVEIGLGKDLTSWGLPPPPPSSPSISPPLRWSRRIGKRWVSGVIQFHHQKHLLHSPSLPLPLRAVRRAMGLRRTGSAAAQLLAWGQPSPSPHSPNIFSPAAAACFLAQNQECIINGSWEKLILETDGGNEGFNFLYLQPPASGQDSKGLANAWRQEQERWRMTA